MSLIHKHFDKNNLHHAYLIEGAQAEIIPEIKKFLESLNIKTSGNPDFTHISIDNFKIDEALDLRAMSLHKSFSSNKKIFVITVNNFSLDAQNVLLKMFEEPIENTIFFLIVPEANALIKTLVSRFYFISARQPARNASRSDSGGGLAEESKEVEKFIKLPLKNRLDFIKELLEEDWEVELPSGSSTSELDSSRTKALKFLNELECMLHNRMPMSKGIFDIKLFEHIFKVREFLRMPGSSPKSLMESVALILPNF